MLNYYIVIKAVPACYDNENDAINEQQTNKQTSSVCLCTQSTRQPICLFVY